MADETEGQVHFTPEDEAIIAMARPMGVLERKAYRKSGFDVRMKGKQIAEAQKSGDFDVVLNIEEDSNDWILEHIYPGLPDTASFMACMHLAGRTFNLTFGYTEEEKGNSSVSSSGIESALSTVEPV